MTLKEIYTKELVVSPLNVKTIKDDISIKELSENIKQHGLLNPLTVILNKNSNKYEIIAGQRRYLAI
jgi:ParB family transcriptional regulator, chromosome partitioning protein